MFPEIFKMRYPTHYKYNVDRAVTDYLIGNINIAVLDILSLRCDPLERRFGCAYSGMLFLIRHIYTRPGSLGNLRLGLRFISYIDRSDKTIAEFRHRFDKFRVFGLTKDL